MGMLKRLTTQEIIRVFGNPGPLMRKDGTISVKWEERIIAYGKFPAKLPLSWDKTKFATKFKCHYKLRALFEAALYDIYAQRSLWKQIGDFGGVYEFRRNRKVDDELSRHAWAIAIDLDVNENQQGTRGNMPRGIIDVFRQYGFLWGGNFQRGKDPMHFEFAQLDLL